jgi:hypothetical protein
VKGVNWMRNFKAATWFVYVESKTHPGKFLYYGEYNGLGSEAEDNAQQTASDLAEKGSKAFITNRYVETLREVRQELPFLNQ